MPLQRGNRMRAPLLSATCVTPGLSGGDLCSLTGSRIKRRTSAEHLSSCVYLPQPAVAADQSISGAVVCERRLLSAFQLGDDMAGQHLAQLHAPLIEGVDVPDGALREDAVLIECHERAERLRCQPLGENGARRPVAFEGAVWHQPFWCALGPNLVRRLAKGQGFSLGEDIRQ